MLLFGDVGLLLRKFPPLPSQGVRKRQPENFACEIPGRITHDAEIKKLSILPAEISQISRSAPKPYFDYEDALALRQMAISSGVDLPRYLLAPEVNILLGYLLDLHQRIFVELIWNTGARPNEVMDLPPSRLHLDGPKPFVVLKTLKQRNKGKGRPKDGELLNRIVPLSDPGFVHRLREYLVTFRPKRHEPVWNIKSDQTPRNWVAAAVKRARANGIKFAFTQITPRTLRHSFAMHLINNHVPLKVVQAYMGHKELSSTEVYTKVFALDVGRQYGVQFSMPLENAVSLLNGGYLIEE
ncbi:TPA: tyrosine-type recombinase/integrase [Klebsiella aerogenes]